MNEKLSHGLDFIQDMSVVCEAAHHLELFLDQNVGDTDDWPIRIACDNPDSVKELTAHLNVLKEALKPLRITMACLQQS